LSLQHFESVKLSLDRPVARQRGADFIGPEKGMLACGYEGIARLWPVEEIVATLKNRRRDQSPPIPAND
jgi:phosphopantothenoylcysteine synthetase/decarboxylase